MRRLDQRIGLIAKLPFAIGELKLRSFQADAAGRLDAEPAMHVVVAEILAGAAEIASAATAKRKARCEQYQSRRRKLRTAAGSGSNERCPAYQFRLLAAATTAAGGRPLFRPAPPLVSSAWRSIRMTGRISTVPMPSRAASSMVEPSRRDAASAGNSMMVPMPNSLRLPLSRDLRRRPSLRTGRG